MALIKLANKAEAINCLVVRNFNFVTQVPLIAYGMKLCFCNSQLGFDSRCCQT